MQFVDECKLMLKAGNGGNGVVAWRREAHYPEGGPWGGDGGNGGDIIVIGDNNFNSLFHLRYLKNIKAPDGEKGQTKLCYGSNGENYIMHVPLGTQIIDSKTNEIIVDITKIGQTFTLLNGGKGGHGNAFFKSSFNKAPTLYENGDIGESKEVILKLKYIADVGLVGLPNAGKSTIISSITNAKPKVANYQFTTVTPVLGTLQLNDKNIIIADIPGLIEDAHEGKGLGFEFLKHIERCHILIHVISLDENDHEDIAAAYNIIKNELELYNSELIEKKHFILANKSDLINSEKQLEKLKKIAKNQEIIVISGKQKENLDLLISKISLLINQKFDEIKMNKEKEEKIHIIELKKEKEIDKSFTYEIDEKNRYIISSKYLSYWLHKIPLNTKDNLLRFNQKMNSSNIEQILKQKGAKPKDTIVINDIEFELD